MEWSQAFGPGAAPSLEQVAAHIASPYWGELCAFIEETYGVHPIYQHSICSMLPGWNIKYRKSGRALCTLYPHEGFFSCMICIGAKEAPASELMLRTLAPQLQKLYHETAPGNGTRWLMIDVTSKAILAGVKTLLAVRQAPPKRREK